MEEYAKEAIIGLFSIVTSWFWFDKNRAQKRFEAIEVKLDSLEKEVAETMAAQDVLDVKLDGIKELMEVKFDVIIKALTK